MNEVYILQENSTRDGLNFDYFCSSLESLSQLVRDVFVERYDDIEKILGVVFNDDKIAIHFRSADDQEDIRIFNNFTFIKIPVK